MPTAIPEHVQLEAERELARRLFYEYCQYRYPQLYKNDRLFLRELCEGIQKFMEQNKKRFLIINLPPRHFKSLTATNLVEWLFGQDINLKVMTGSYNEILSGTFARKVRDTIDELRVDGDKDVYADLFPKTQVKYGQASKSLWSLVGNPQDNYLATSPTGTATGFGANLIIIDDILKNAEEAYNILVKDKHWDWFTNTMLSRTEGNNWKVIGFMTRWATDDLSGRIIQEYGDLAQVIQYKAVQDDGSMLCEDILNHEDYVIKTKEMAVEIVEANYNQAPIDIQGRLYESFMTYERLPKTAKDAKIWNYTDTADKGADFLCSVDYIPIDGDVYILDVVISDEAMEKTEPQVAAMLNKDGVNEAEIESNSGGRGFGRNVERLLKDMKNYKCVITEKNQTANKEARILSSSAWVQRHVYMPPNWIAKYPEFAKQLLSYQRKGKNKNDDAPDVLAGIYERVANTQEIDWSAWSVK